MRVLVVASWPPWPLTDGARLVLHHHLRELAGRHEITVLAGGREPGEAPPAEALSPEVRALTWLGAGRGAAAYARRRGRGWVTRPAEPDDTVKLRGAGVPAAFDRLLAEVRPDVVHLHGWGTAALAGRTRGIPAVHMAIDSWTAGLREQRALPAGRRLLEWREPARVRAHEARWYPQCAAVIVVSGTDADAVRAVASSARVEVVPNGVAPGADAAPLPDAPVLGFHGVLGTVANADAAISLARDVLPLVRTGEPRASALLIGRDPPAAVRALAGDGVVVTGGVEAVRPWLDGVAVYVAFLRRGSGIKNKVLEAMAAGRPVVATPTAVAGIGPGDGIEVVDDAAGAARAVLALLDDRDRAMQSGLAGRQRVRNRFGWDRSARRIEELWADAVDGRAR